MIVQFGTSRFLQAHVDLFASEARDAGQHVPDIVIVQTTRDAERARRLTAFAERGGFPVIVRGMEDGVAVERTVQVRSVVRGLSVAADWAAIMALVRDTATHIVSNAGDTGYDIGEGDRVASDADSAPTSFPAILVELLHGRWQAGRDGVTVLPCELVSRNGDVLREVVTGLAREQARDPAFTAWLSEHCIWANSLVDRIVSESLKPAGAVTEPYALWAVERAPGLRMPFEHPAIVLTDDLASFERLKLHILNLGHSWLAERWQQAGAMPGVTVGAALSDPATRAAFDRLMTEEVVPGFAARGMDDAARTYVETTVVRFENPFLRHLLADIHAHHAVKVAKRIGGFVRWVDEADGVSPPMPELRDIAVRYGVAA